MFGNVECLFIQCNYVLLFRCGFAPIVPSHPLQDAVFLGPSGTRPLGSEWVLPGFKR